MEAYVHVEGSDEDRASLYDWLLHESALRGRVEEGTAPAPEGTMGTSTELVIQLAGATAIWVALARCFSVWVTQRHSDVKIEVTAPSGMKVSVSAKRVAALSASSLEQELKTALDIATSSHRAEEH